MPQFILLCHDKPGALALRMETRAAHLKYFDDYGSNVIFGGPMLDPGGSPAGSMLVIEAADEAAAQQMADGDPYRKAGVFETVEIIPFRLVIANQPE